jgi:glycopeptide antibiotics resistance protein
MIYALAYALFILGFTAWLGKQLKLKYSLKKHWRWIAAACVLGLIGAIISRIYPSRFGNFLLHAGGGASATLLFIYLTKTLNFKFSWQVTSVLLFGFVCGLGVLNELAEYLCELLGLGMFSFDAHDTWRDLTANTTGMVAVWMVYSLTIYNFRAKR